MQARLDWVLIIFGTQVIKKKWPVRLVFPDYLSVSCDYGRLKIPDVNSTSSIIIVWGQHPKNLCEIRKF